MKNSFDIHLQAQSGKLYNVGYMVLDLRYKQDKLMKSMTVSVWYPTEDTPRMFQYGRPTWGKAALNGKPLTWDGRSPLLAFLHGFGGSGLASHGWVVVCPDHHDSYNLASSREGRVKKPDIKGTVNAAKEITSAMPGDRDRYLYNPEELKTAIGKLLSSDIFGQIIDTSRIAAGRHSFRGFTSLALCGAIPEYYDPCITSLLIFSTDAAGYLFTEDELVKLLRSK